MDDFDRIEQLTWRLLRRAAVFVPLWILGLALFPLTGMGVLGCLLSATVVAGVAAWLWERRRGRAGAGSPPRPGRHRPLGPLAASGLTLAAVALLVYVVFVLRSA